MTQFWKRKLPAALTAFALLAGAVPAASAASADITYEVDAGESVALSRSDFKDFFDAEFDGEDTFRYVTFSPEDDYGEAGYLYFDYDGDDEERFRASALEDAEFYYSSSDYGDYALRYLSFVADEDAEDATVTLDFRAYGDDDDVRGTLKITVNGEGSDGDITYEVDAGESVALSRTDFKDFFDDEMDGDDTFRYVTFLPDSDYGEAGYLYFDYDGSDEERFRASALEDTEFYYNSSDYGDYALRYLSFVADEDAEDTTVTINFRAYGDDGYVKGTLTVTVGDGDGSSADGDIDYTVEQGEYVTLDRTDFKDFFDDEMDGEDTFRYVTFSPDSDYGEAGYLYFDYDGDDEVRFRASALEDAEFYYSSSDYGDYALRYLSFVADEDAEDAEDATVTLDFRAYGDDGYVKGTLTVTVGNGSGGGLSGDILYTTTTGTSVQLNANDFARFLRARYETSSLQYVTIDSVPSTGTLYYDYYGTSSYGSGQFQLTRSNCDARVFYFSPAAVSDLALSELTYVPSGTNYCVEIAFTVHGSGSRTVSGTVLIGVTGSAVSEVYGATPINTSVTFPAYAISMAVASATGQSLGSIQLLQLPDTAQGQVYQGTGSTKANATTRYSASKDEIEALRFVPASGYTGSVQIPYAAYDSDGDAIAVGTFSLGIVRNLSAFSDVTATTWCYKYVTELSDADVIDGYSDKTFHPNDTITYGAALKLIMLAAGYSEQPATGSNVFSGYLARAQADGLVSGSVDLTGSITRLQMAQLAAKALKLDTSGLSSVQPFTDTSDVYVRALNAADIVEGYFSNGTSTYRPDNTLTRGQIAAIVWRMQQYQD